MTARMSLEAAVWEVVGNIVVEEAVVVGTELVVDIAVSVGIVGKNTQIVVVAVVVVSVIVVVMVEVVVLVEDNSTVVVACTA